jgi:hypothetical protein
MQRRKPKNSPMENYKAQGNSSIKNLLEDSNFELSANISNHQPVWNNDKIVTFLDIGGVGNENTEDSPRHSPQGMTTDQFLSQNSLQSHSKSSSINSPTISNSPNPKRINRIEFELTPTENDEGRLSSNGADSSNGLDDSSSALASSSDGFQSTLNFDPKTRHFSPEELKPTPIQRKSRKTVTKDSDKDDRYWDKRKKNNLAAKRSREARRSRENQISMRASFLEKDNAILKEELLTVKEELQSLKEKLITVQQQRDLGQNKCQNFHRNNN